jgi:hypothetical protein
MKTTIQITLALFFMLAQTGTGRAQNVTGGISAGASFNSVKIENAVNHLGKKENVTGAELGLFLHAPFGAFYLRPSVNAGFARGTINTFSDEAMEEQFDFKMNTIEVPVLAGLQLLPFISAEAGPSWNYIASWSDNINGTTVNINRHAMGYRAGVRLSFSSLDIYGHYGGILTKHDGNSYHLSRPSRIMVGLGLNLGK